MLDVAPSGSHETSNSERNLANMARIDGIDPQHTSFLMRQVFKKVRKMLGRDLTPQKIQARVPRLFWFRVSGGVALGPEGQSRATAACDCDITYGSAGWMPLFESTPILPGAECMA